MPPALLILMTGFWLLMLYDCIQNDPEKHLWFFVFVFLYFLGAILYFLLRWIPRSNLPITKYFHKWTRRRELWMAEAAARNIGKAHQYIMLGNLLCDMAMLDKAADAYQQALEKEPKNPQALWGAAFVDMESKNYESAKERLETLLKIDPEYKYGEASLAYAQTLLALQEMDAVEVHLDKHLKYWGHPEAYIMMANLQAKQGKSQEARRYLETMLARVKGSTYYHYQRNRHLVKKAERLLSSLGH